jgi:CheY-like chemotaxis protein
MPQIDLQMPVMDGVEAVRLIRAHEAADGLSPSLIYMGMRLAFLAPRVHADRGSRTVSGQSFDTDKRRAVEAAADGYFIKPLSLHTLDHFLALHFPLSATQSFRAGLGDGPFSTILRAPRATVLPHVTVLFRPVVRRVLCSAKKNLGFVRKPPNR